MPSEHPCTSEIDLARRQLAGLETWVRELEAARRAATEATASREQRMDAARRRDALELAHAVVVERLDGQLARSVHPMRQSMPPRVVLAHRHDWFADRLARGLARHGVEVLVRVTTGAEVVGVSVAEQPDLVLVEDPLPMIAAEEAVQQLRRFVPAAVVVACVPYEDRVSVLLEAGATAAHTRRVPPDEVCRGVVELLATRGDGGVRAEGRHPTAPRRPGMTQPDAHDARTEQGDPTTDPAAIGEVRAAHPDGDGGAVPAQEQERAEQDAADA